MEEKRGNKEVIIFLGIAFAIFLITFILAIVPDSPMINSPLNNSFTSNNWTIINLTVTDQDAGDNLTVYIYASNSSAGLINNSKNLVYKNIVANGTQITYNLTAFPVNPSGILSNGLVALFHFDNMSEFGENDTYVYDFSRNGNNGKVVGGSNISWIPSGKFGGTFNHPSRVNYINVSNDSSLNFGNKNFTISLWARIYNTSVSQFLFVKRDTAGQNEGYSLSMNVDNTFYFVLAGGVNLLRTLTTDTFNTNDGKWHHLVVMRDNATSLSMFYDGNRMNETEDNINDVNVDNPANLYLGINRDAVTLPLNGSIDEFTVWNRSLSASEIQSLYSLGSGRYYWEVNVSDDGGANTLSNVNTFYINYTAVNNVTITYPVQYSVWQRHNSTTGTMPIYGTYSNQGVAPNAIETSFNGGPYVNISISPSGGIFSGQLNASVGNGTLIVRFSNNASVNYSINNIGVGDVFVIAGQSNAVGYAFNEQSLNTSNKFMASAFMQNHTWKLANDPISSIDNHNSTWPLVANYIVQNQSIPIAFIQTAIDGTDILEWQKSQPKYEQMYGNLSVATNGSMKVKAMLWFQGERDTRSDVGVNGNYDNYKSNLTKMTDNFINDADIATTILVGQINYLDNAATNRTLTDNIRKAQQDLWYDNNNISRGPITYDISLYDKTHFRTNDEINAYAKRWWASIGEQIYNISSLAYPKLANITLWTNSTTSNLTLTFNSLNFPLVIENYNGTSGTFIQGWRIKDGDIVYNDTNIINTIINNNRIIIQLPYVLSNSTNITYGSYTDSYGKNVSRDNSTYKLPIELIYEATIDSILDTIIPLITNISSPLNITYSSSNILFNISTNENSTCNYTVDSGITNYSMTANSSGTGFTASQTLSNANYLVRFYCWDIYNNLNNSQTVNFSISVPSSSSTNSDSSSVGSPSTFSATNSEIELGYSKPISVNGVINFNINSEKHSVKLTKLSLTTATINISSSKSYLSTFLIGDSKRFELTGDNFYDLFVKLNSIKNNKANFTIQKINEEITSEKTNEEQKKAETVRETQKKEIEENVNDKLLKQKYWIVSFVIVLIIIILVSINAFHKKKRKRLYGF